MKKVYEDYPKYTEEEIKALLQYENMVYKVWSLLEDNWIKTSHRDELLSAGFDGLRRAIMVWDPERGNKASFFSIVIKHRMYREIHLIMRREKRTVDIDAPIKNDRGDKEGLIKDLIVDETENVEERAIDKETARELEKIIAQKCNKREIEILDLYCNHDMSYFDIAKQIGISRQRLHQIINRARKKILKKYEKGLDN